MAFFERSLSEPEAGRLNRYVFQRDRKRYAINRGVLRTLLAGYLSQDPASVIIESTPSGKPFVPKPFNQEDIQFNLAHSHGSCVIAICRSGQVGIDLEKTRPIGESLEIARRHFSPVEIKTLEACRGQTQRELFFRYWTCKEAYVKAHGQGLAMPMSQFSIEFESTWHPRLVSPDSGQWRILAFPLDGSFVAALVVEAAVNRVQHFRFPGASALDR